MLDFGLFLLRLALGGLLAGHGAQKLFGAFGGHGLRGTAGFFESALGLKPGKQWALAAGAGEMGGGLLTVLGFLHPIGPITTMAPMIVAWGTAHWGKPIWASAGGAELPLLNLTIATALVFIGPGKLSIDRLLGSRTSPALSAFTAACVAIGAFIALTQPQPEQLQQHARQNQPSTA